MRSEGLTNHSSNGERPRLQKRARVEPEALPYSDRAESKKERKKNRKQRARSEKYSAPKAETLQAEVKFDASKLRMASTGWIGVKLGDSQDVRELQKAYRSDEIFEVLKHFTWIEFVNPHL